MKFLYIPAIIFLLVSSLYTQPLPFVRSVIPDTGSQGASFEIVVHGIGTEFTLSPYFVVNFDSTNQGIGTYAASIVNDTTLTAQLFVDGKATVGYHTCYIGDQYNNVYYKDSAFKVFLNIPVTPTLLLPFNNATNVSQTPYFLWDSNIYVTSYRFQISNDSTFLPGSLVFDTNIANTPLILRAGLLNLDTRYFWRVNATNSIGTGLWSDYFKFRVKSVGIRNISAEIPGEYLLFPNFPNPFNATTKIRFSLPQGGNTILEVYDLNGKRVSVLMKNYLSAGTYEYTWDASGMASGIYFILFESGVFRNTAKAVVIK